MILKKSNHTFFRANYYLLLVAAFLIVISFIIEKYWSSTSTDEGVTKLLQKNIQSKQKDFADFCKDTNLIRKLATKKYNEETLHEIEKKDYFLFIIKNDTAQVAPVFWSTQVVWPDESIITGKDTSYLTLLTNGWYIFNNKTILQGDSIAYDIIALIPVKWDYYVQNKYLQNTFVGVEGLEKQYDISHQEEKIAIKGTDGNILFYLHKTDNSVVPKNNPLTLWLRILAAFFVLLYIHICANYYTKQKGLLKGFTFLLVCVVVLRFLSYVYPIPVNFKQFELFHPAIYGVNIVFRSLGDLLINSILFAWFVLFLRYHINARKFQFKPGSNFQRYFLFGFTAVGLITITLVCGHIVRSIVADSQISFDVINFFSLTGYSVIGFVVLGFISIGYFFLTQILLHIISLCLKGHEHILYIIIAVEALLVLTLRVSSIYISFDLFLLLWGLLFIFLMNLGYLNLSAAKMVSAQFIFWVFFFSVSITTVIIFQNQIKELENRKHFAENLYNKTDPAGERMMNIILTDFNNNFLSKIFYRFQQKNENRFLKDSLINENFSGYLNKYDTKLYIFDADKQPLYNDDPTLFNSLNAVIQTQAKATPFKGLFYYDISYDRFNYISKKEITNDQNILLGYIFILSSPKNYKSDALYPELFSKGNANSIESSPLYAYAIYKKGRLSSSYNDYAFATTIENDEIPNNGFLLKTKNKYDELWYKPAGDKIIVIAKPGGIFIESITLFAYLFFSFLLLTALLNALNVLLSGNLRFKNLKFFWPSIRSQVHNTIILISFLSFVVIGFTTILFFIDRYHTNNREKLSRTIHVMESEIKNNLDSFSVYNNNLNVYQLAPTEKLEQMINKIAESQSTDINIYDVNGDLKISSLPLPYNSGIVSTKIDPEAYYHLNKLKDVQFFKDQKIGTLQYLSNYVPIRDDDGKEYAYLNIPYFESENKLQEEISNFLVTIINLNAFIFLIAGIIALFITNRVTRTFSLISNKMKEVNLGKMNEEIKWNRKDEIGALVKEYNKMVKKLDESAVMLARSEREGAWKEMARQVAHEIKNPLTPMKLNLQHLQKAIDDNSSDVKNISMRVSKILVEQIDHLAQIASDFSQFANIGITQNVVFDLNDSIKHIASLYATNEKLKLTFMPHKKEILIEADRTQINRLFTNLLQNAVQSIPNNKKALIEITSFEKNANVTVAVKDNGTGIPADMMDKIFAPNFTTKSSGTGLGLAMCKGIVEKLGGTIWFETEENNYTIFYVQLPITLTDK